MEVKYINTESGDRLTTESGDRLIMEYSHGSIENDLALIKTFSNPPIVLSVTAWSACLANIEVKNATSYPEFHIRGPGKLLAIENHTTKQGLYFINLELVSSDYIIIKIDPVNGMSMKGKTDLINHLSPASDTELSLTPGANNLSLTYESNFELVSGDSDLDNFLVNGLTAENTNNGNSFIISQTDPGGGADQRLQFKDYDNNVLAEGYIGVGLSSLCYLTEYNNSGVTGTIAPGGTSSGSGATWEAENTSATFKVGLVSVVWKNRRWSIDEAIEV